VTSALTEHAFYETDETCLSQSTRILSVSALLSTFIHPFSLICLKQSLPFFSKIKVIVEVACCLNPTAKPHCYTPHCHPHFSLIQGNRTNTRADTEEASADVSGLVSAFSPEQCFQPCISPIYPGIKQRRSFLNLLTEQRTTIFLQVQLLRLYRRY
jgi:hypothetical protein